MTSSFRKLATIQRVEDVRPIEDTDKLGVARVLGWQVVVNRHEIKPGDLVVFIEVDSIVPDRPEFEFMKPRKFKVKTIRLRNFVSQGLCLPVGLFPELSDDLTVGRDVTEVLGIVKAEETFGVSGDILGPFPSFLPKTDEPRIQLLPDLLPTLSQHGPLYITEKLDGSSFTCYLVRGEDTADGWKFGVCSRNFELKESATNAHWAVARRLELEERLKKFGASLALQGELVGPKIQDNRLKLPAQTVYFFNVIDLNTLTTLSMPQARSVLSRLGLQFVPIIEKDVIGADANKSVDEWVSVATRKSLLNPEVWAEGIVVRPSYTRFVYHAALNCGRLSFKVINPEFLLAYGL